MRVSTSQIYARGVEQMRNIQASLDKTQTQVASGIKLSNPSDDPIAFSQSLKLKEEIAINDQFSNNIKSARGRNELMDSQLGSAIVVLQRIRELTLQASNDTLGAADRAGIATEVRILQDELAGIMNSRNGSGEFVFGGFQGREQPFVEREGGGYDYVGDEGQRVAQISAASYVDVSDSGKDLFVDIQAARNTIVTSNGVNNDPDGGASISVGQVFDQLALDQVFPEKFIITFGDPAENQNRRTYTVTRASDGAPVTGTDPAGSLENITYVPGETIDFHGIRVSVGGNPQPGDAFFVESSGNQSVMNTIERLALALESLAINPVVLEGTSSLIGRAAPARPTITSAGNYVASQTLTLTGDDGTIQTVSVSANQTVGSIAADLDALTGITASYQNAQAVLDFSSINADEGDVIQFNVNGVAVQAIAGSTLSQTLTNVDAALGALLPTGGLSYTNEGNAQFRFEESNGNDISVDGFQVQDFPGVELDVTSGFAVGETIQMTLTGSNGEVLNLSYVAVVGDVDELATNLQAQIIAQGLAGVMTATQSAAGQPIAIRYTGDTDGDAAIALSNLTDNNNDDVVLSVTPLTGSDATDSVTNGAVTSLRTGFAVNVAAQEGRSSLGVQGVIGDMVSLQDNGNDSTSVAAQLVYQASAGYELTSDTPERDGGLVSQNDLEDTITLQFREAINSSLSNIDNALDNVTRARSRTGARLNLLETAQLLNEGMNVELQEFLSNIQDLDYAEALTEVNMKTFILEAAQNTFVRMSSLSLFNFI